MSEPLLKISNHHIAGSGDPPIIDDCNRDHYIGYFENLFGEQWIFTRDRKTSVATLRGGDIGWNELIDVTEGSSPKLMLNATEQQWLQSCLTASRKPSMT